jgi:YcxB-like protein
VEVEYRLTRGDSDAFYRHHNAKRWFVSKVLILGGGTLLTFGLAWSFYHEVLTGLAVFLIAFLVLCVAVVPWIRLRLDLSQAGKEMERRFEKGNGRISLAPDGMYVSTAETQSFVKWTGVHRIVQTATHAFFYITEEQAFILPARAFPSDVEFRTFVGLARSHIEKQPPVAPEPLPSPSDAITRKTDFTT